jgi:hypothetical protein
MERSIVMMSMPILFGRPLHFTHFTHHPRGKFCENIRNGHYVCLSSYTTCSYVRTGTVEH